MENPGLLQHLPIAFMFLLAVGFIVLTMVVTHAAGPKRNSTVKLESFECGIESKGNARFPSNIKYFLVAILFVLFDVEVIFMYPWAVNFDEMGAGGFVKMVLFMSTLLIGFFYILKKGALKW